MTEHFLTRIEQLLVRWLSRSPRVGAIYVRQYDSVKVWAIEDQRDLYVVTRNAEQRLRQQVERDWAVEAHSKSEVPEPLSMLLERLYHSPDAER